MGSDDKPTISKPTQGYAAEITDSDEYYGKNLSGKIAASDPEGSTLTFAKWSDPSYGDFSIDWNTGVWVYTPRINGLGNEVVYDKLTVEVSDGLHSESVEWDIKLDGENDAPEIVEGHGQEQLSADWGGSVIFDINAYDYYAEIDIYSSSSNLVDGFMQ